VGERRAVGRRRERVLQMLHTLPPAAQQAIRDSYAEEPQFGEPLSYDPPTGPIRPQPLPRKRSAGSLARDEPTEVIGGYDAGYDDPASRDSDRS
jgi:phospholipid/cholesterol/gamma-HCH transport system ATP-binding protein